MEAQVDAGLAKSIGLSNFNISQIKRVLQSARIPPSNLQVELHAFFQQKELVDFCKEHNIIVCAYAPLGSRGTAKLYERAGIRCELILICYVQFDLKIASLSIPPLSHCTHRSLKTEISYVISKGIRNITLLLLTTKSDTVPCHFAYMSKTDYSLKS